MPDWQIVIRRRLAGLNLAPTCEAEIVEELSQHLQDRYDERRAVGASGADASREAMSELDDTDLLSRQLADVERRVPSEPAVFGSGGMPMIVAAWQDVRYAARTLRQNRALLRSSF